MSELRKGDIERLLEALGDELEAQNLVGELYLVGGAVLSLVYDAREATEDVDGYFQPAAEMRKIAARIATREGVEPDWLNDAVKRFLSPEGTFDPYLERSHLRVLVAQPEYLLAMKCLAMRLGPEYADEADIRFLIRTLNLTTAAQVKTIIEKYYPIERFPQRTLYALEEICG